MSILTIKVENKTDISLVDLTTSLLSLGGQYNRFLDRLGIYDDEVKKPLIVKKLISGSIIIELVSSAIPVINDINTIFVFTNYFKDSIDYFLGKKQQPPINYDKKDLEQYNNITGLISNSPNSTLTISADGDVNQNIHFIVGYIEANAAQNGIKKELDRLKELPATIHEKQLLTWYQVRFDNKSKHGDRGIIENIYHNPLRVIFSNEDIKNQIINSTGFAKPWQELAYIVDVELLLSNHKPKIYKILNFYPEETFDPTEN